MEENNEKFWAIVELFGHTVLAGQVSKCEISDFVQINIPKAKAVPEWTKMVNPKAIYAITPTTEEVARAKAESITAIPVDRWDTEQFFSNRLEEVAAEGKIKRKGIPKEELRPIEVHMRENGTLDNKPSFAIIMVDKSGNRYLGQLSLKMMNTGFNDIGYEIKKISNG